MKKRVEILSILDVDETIVLNFDDVSKKFKI